MWLLKDVVSVDQVSWESLSREDQIKWVESSTIPNYQKEELKKKCNGKRKRVDKEIKQTKSPENTEERGEDSSEKSTDKKRKKRGI